MTRSTITQRAIGYRVKSARESKNLNQEQLAQILEFNDRQTISDIENGKRALKPNELILLSEQLDKDIDFFLDPFNISGEALFSWRAPKAIENELNNFEFKVGKYIGLFRWLRENKYGASNPIKRSLRITSKPSYEDAIRCGEDLVSSASLGDIPSKKILTFIEQDLDIPVLFVDIDTESIEQAHSISGAACHLRDMAVILINRNEPDTRRNLNLCHELFHILTWDTLRPEHIESCSSKKYKRIEQLADNFAVGLLIPLNSLESIVDKTMLNNIKYLVEIALLFMVSPTTLAWRLFNLKWINEDTRVSLQNEHINKYDSPRPLSYNFVKLLHETIECGKLSVRKAANTLNMNLEELKHLFNLYSFKVPFDL